MDNLLNTNTTPYSAFIYENTESFIHQHEQIELSYILSGNVTYTSPEYSCVLQAGQVIIHFPYEPHGFSCTGIQSCMLTLQFDIDFVPDFVRRFCEYLLPDNVFSKKELEPSTHDALNWLLRYATEEFTDSPDTTLLKQRGWLTAILGDLFYKHNLMKREIKLEPEMIHSITEYMEHNLDKNFSMEELARASGISRQYLTHNLKQVVFVTYNTLLTTTRIKHAEKLLANAKLSLLDVSLACGFSSLSTFNRNYKKITGITPSEFRKQLQAATPEE